MTKRRGSTIVSTGPDREALFLEPIATRSGGQALHQWSRGDDVSATFADWRWLDEQQTALASRNGAVRPGHAAAVSSVDFPRAIDLATLDGTNGFRLDGTQAGDLSGCSVSDAGDVNGDGFDDFIIGARGAEPGGRSYVVFGTASGFPAVIDLSTLDGTNGFCLDGDEYSASGVSVSNAGDVNGDGFDDLIIGAYRANASGYGQGDGRAYVVFGHGGAFSAKVDLSKLNGADGFRLEGIHYSWSGFSVSSAGDINGDGFDDVIIGSPAPFSEEYQRGYATVVFGHGGAFDKSLSLSSLGDQGFSLRGLYEFGQLGISVSSAGDINGDGFDDIIVGQRGPGRNANPYDPGQCYVVFGKAGSFDGISLSSLNGHDGFRIVGVDGLDVAGMTVSSAGDINGDGFDDILVGASQADHAKKENAGESYVVFGKEKGFASTFYLADLDGTNGFRLDGIDAFDGSGARISAAGDVNGDGFDDIIIGATGADTGNGRYAGECYVVFGKAGGFSAVLSLSALNGTNGFRLDGVNAGDTSAYVSAAGDVNGDGFDDIIIGAPGADPNGDSSGQTYVIYGRAPTEAVTRTGSAADQTIRGGAFDDALNGKGGNDRLGGGEGADALNGGTGKDWAYYDTAAAGVHASLDAPGRNTGEAAGDTYHSIENLRGSSFADELTGNALANQLKGGDGADKLSGHNGSDTLIGDAGHDLLIGGRGADSFRFLSLLAADADTITDFVAGEDRVALDDKVFGFAEGPLPAGAFVVAGTAQDADDRVIYDAATGNLFFDPDGNGAEAQVLIVTLTGAPTLAASDLVVF